MNLSLLTLNLHTYQQHPRHCCFDTMHQHEREVNIITEAIANLKVHFISLGLTQIIMSQDK